MAVDSLVHVNESGLPLNAIEWLETHHRSKAPEREQMIRDLHLKKGSYVVDAGCGPGHWSSYRSSLAVLISSLAQMSANTSLIQSRYLRHWVNTLFLADDLPSRISTLALCAFTMSMGHYRLAFSRHASVGSAYA